VQQRERGIFARRRLGDDLSGIEETRRIRGRAFQQPQSLVAVGLRQQRLEELAHDAAAVLYAFARAQR